MSIEFLNLRKYITGDQDGVYYLTLLNASNKPTVAPFTEEKYSQPVKQLFPQTDRDNPTSDPEESQCFADPNTIGLVDINDPRNSVTRETLNKYLDDFKVGVRSNGYFICDWNCTYHPY